MIVLGDKRVLTLDAKVSSPGEAFGAFQETDDSSLVSKMREGFEKVAGRAIQIRARRNSAMPCKTSIWPRRPWKVLAPS